MKWDLKPNAVFQYFERICSIPHGSYQEQKISNYCVDFAKERHLDYIQDECGNVIIFKPASSGYEHTPSVILQGHLDMVCEKEAAVDFDFAAQGIQVELEGDFLHAGGTTLGADNGIAVAYMLALLDSDNIPHPALETVFTVQEEVGLIGAARLDMSALKSRYMINLDNGSESELIVSCAGGVKAVIELPVQFATYSRGIEKTITISGLKGGHSGIDIQSGRANANVLMGQILFQLHQELDIGIVKLQGGQKDNVIPRDAFAVLLIQEDQEEKFDEIMTLIIETLKAEFCSAEKDLAIQVAAQQQLGEALVMDMHSKEKIIFFMVNVMNGVQSMSADIEGLVESSLNFGVLSTSESNVTIEFGLRSNIESKKLYMSSKLEYFTEFLGGIYNVRSEYPSWAYKKDSALGTLCVDCYQRLNNSSMKVEAVHAGLECGIFAEALDNADIVAFGPDMYDIHSPNERLSVSSVKRTWEFLLSILKDFQTLPDSHVGG